MGLVSVEAKVSGRSGEDRQVEFLLDSGMMYSVLPHDVWRALDLSPERAMIFTLADGTRLRREISECRVAFSDQEWHTPVVLGEPGDVPLLGVITLEEFGLVLNPFSRTLQPMRMVLA